MPAKSRFTRLDAFAKTVEDARIRTTSGGIITIASLLIILWLVWGEWVDYRRVVVMPELVVDKSRGTSSHCCQEWLPSKGRLKLMAR
jgi:hypothetical protein